MYEGKDPAIKLFGKTIPLPSIEEVAVDDVCGGQCSDGKVLIFREERTDENALSDEFKEEDRTSQPVLKEFKDHPVNSSADSDFPKTPSGDNEAKTNEEQNETSNSQDKTLKKPDKILPCPRCNSMDTKFCYFNNYNVNQHRHFCKDCQRYWTAGGTMRNVPVGAGRRKNKSSSASQHRHIVIPEVFQAMRPDAANGMIHPSFTENGAVLAIVPDVPLSESMASRLNLRDKSPKCISNGSSTPENMVSQSSGCYTASSDRINNGGVQQPVIKNFAVFPPQLPCIPAPPWPRSLDPTKSSSSVSPSPFLSPGVPLSFYAIPPYWGCLVPGAWNMPWVTPVHSISPDHSSSSSSPNSPYTRGKHTREGNMLNISGFPNREEGPKEKGTGTGVLVPKTLSFDDPCEAAKSSIWTTLGIQNEKGAGDSLNSRGLNGFKPVKEGPRTSDADKPMVLKANPAALSRSLRFQESAA